MNLVEQLRGELAAAGDPERAAGQQAYMKSELPFHGVRVPEVRKIANATIRDTPKLNAESWRSAILELWDEAYFREERYAALNLLRSARYRTYRTPDIWPLLEHLIRTGAWWDLVDETSHVVDELVAANPNLKPNVRVWITSDDMWLRRTSIICQLTQGPNTDLDLLTEAILANNEDREFFIAKAIGWALRQYAKTDPDWVSEFVASHDLRPLSVREATKHLTN